MQSLSSYITRDVTDSCDAGTSLKAPGLCAHREHVALERAVLREVRQLVFGLGL